MSPLLGDLDSSGIFNQSKLEVIKIGSVIFFFVNGKVKKRKRVIILDEYDDKYAFILINTLPNPNFYNEDQIKKEHYLLVKEDSTEYIEYDSYAECCDINYVNDSIDSCLIRNKKLNW